MTRHLNSLWSATWSVHESHVIIAWSVKWSVREHSRDQCMISQVTSTWSVTWTVHAQSRDQGLLSFVITVCSSAWQLPDELYDSCLSSPWQLPPVLHNSCPAHLLDYCQLSSMISQSWVPWLLPTDSCLLSSLFTASRGTWSVYDSKHDQHMMNHIINAW